MSPTRRKRLIRTCVIFLALVALIVGLVVKCNGSSSSTNSTTRTASIKGDVVKAPDGRVSLTIPKGARTPGTTVGFTTDVAAAKTIDSTAKGVSALGPVVDIHTTRGALQPNKVLVTFVYDPGKLPHGVTAANLGMVVFDTNLDAWVPIMDTTVNEKARTISAIAPHFSLYDTVFLNPAKSVVHAAGQVIHTVINGTVTVAKWFKNLVAQLTVDFIKDLTGTAPSLKCNPVSQSVKVTTTSFANRLSGCVQSTSGSDNTVRLRNGYAFPVRINPMPAGMTQRFDDIWTNGGDLVNLMRNTFWAMQHQAVLPGADIGSVTATSQIKNAKLSLNIDNSAVAFDIVTSFVTVVMPEDSAVQAALEKNVKRLVSVGKELKPGETNTPMAWVTHTMDSLQCVNTNLHDMPSNPFGSSGVRYAADLAHDCLSSMLSALNLQNALAGLLDAIKVIPATIETVLAQLVNKGLADLANINTTSFSATVSRKSTSTVSFHGMRLTLPAGWTQGKTFLAEPDSDVLSIRTKACNVSSSTTDCQGFQVRGSGAISQGYPPVDYTDGSWDRGSDSGGCPADRSDYPHITEQSQKVRGTAPIGNKTAVYTEWLLTCESPTGGKSMSFVQRTWFLPETKLLIVDDWDSPGLYDVLKNATWLTSTPTTVQDISGSVWEFGEGAFYLSASWGQMHFTRPSTDAVCPEYPDSCYQFDFAYAQKGSRVIFTVTDSSHLPGLQKGNVLTVTLVSHNEITISGSALTRIGYKSPLYLCREPRTGFGTPLKGICASTQHN